MVEFKAGFQRWGRLVSHRRAVLQERPAWRYLGAVLVRA